MQTVQFVLLQLDDAVRHVSDGRVPQLRVALLLLDNAAEVLLHRWAESQLIRDCQTRKLHENATRWGPPEKYLRAFDISDLLSPAEEKKVLRLFDRLVRYAVLKNSLDPNIADALIYLHRYRNDAYHRAHIRDATIRTSVVLLFDIVCRLILTDVGHIYMYSSAEDYSWLTDRFEVPQRGLFPGDEFRSAAVAKLRSSLPPGSDDVANIMATHLEARLTELLDALKFISSSLRDTITHDEVLEEAIRYVEAQKDDPWLADRMPRGFNKRISLQTTREVASIAEELRAESEVISAFRTFAKAELELENLEFAVFALAGEVDSQIQMQIDIARGK